MKKWLGLLLLFLLIIGCDIASKAYVNAHIPYFGLTSPYYPYGGIAVFQGFLGGMDFSINHVINAGAAWGVLSKYQHLLVYVRMALVGFLMIYIFFINKVASRLIPLVLVISGAIGNLIDTFYYGYVIDFLHFKFWSYSYPLFNIADSAIFCGAALLMLQAYFQRKKKKQEASSAN